MDLQVLSLSQDVSFEDGSITNFVVLRSPSGHVLRAVITDESARLLVENLAAQKVGSPMPARQAPSPQYPQAPVAPPPARQHVPDDDGPVVFGGDPDGDGAAPAPAPWLPTAEDPPPPTGFTPPPTPPQEYADVDSQTRAYKRQQRLQNEQMKRGGTFNGKHIPKDDAGYPIVAGGQGADPGELVGGGGAGGADEDGVGQV